MVIKGVRTIAYKCPVCGSIEFNTISIFDLSVGKGYIIRCSCGNGFVKIVAKRNRSCTISMSCIACNHIHHYSSSLKALWTNNIMNFICPNTGIEFCFIGRDDLVRKSVDQYELKMDLLMNDIGYDDYFINNTVMLNTIDKIHDVAESGNLFCQCGNSDIDLLMFFDRVELICNRCQTIAVIDAGTNQDLKKTLSRDSIVLCDSLYGEAAVDALQSNVLSLKDKHDILKAYRRCRNVE